MTWSSSGSLPQALGVQPDDLRVEQRIESGARRPGLGRACARSSPASWPGPRGRGVCRAGPAPSSPAGSAPGSEHRGTRGQARARSAASWRRCGRGAGAERSVDEAGGGDLAPDAIGSSPEAIRESPAAERVVLARVGLGDQFADPLRQRGRVESFQFAGASARDGPSARLRSTAATDRSPRRRSGRAAANSSSRPRATSSSRTPPSARVSRLTCFCTRRSRSSAQLAPDAYRGQGLAEPAAGDAQAVHSVDIAGAGAWQALGSEPGTAGAKPDV